ncbi:LytTR family DNA-binding domain-containing protein [Burkholderiaceae bacterium DAT-1]|nr:LytTR family DNA-binding domain-containing protein [Burkholderiaceae bacterium DAT-1]
MTALITDDEPLARMLVREYLSHHPDIQIVGECSNGLEAVKQIGALNPDLVFLDIQMPKLTGLEVLELTERRQGVIFTTAYDQFALQAFNLHAVDYLLKPFSQTRFDEALARARKLLPEPQAALDKLVQDASQQQGRLLIKDREQVHVVPIDRISYVLAQDDYISIHADGKSYLKTQSLSDLESKLDPQRFVRIHRSCLINLQFLKAIEKPAKDTQLACMQDGERLPISRTGQERLRELM